MFRDPLSNIGIGRADDDINLVTEALQLSRDVIEVNPLATTVHIAPIA